MSRPGVTAWGCLRKVPNGYCDLKGIGVSCAILYNGA